MDENQALLEKEFNTGNQERGRKYSYRDEYSDEVQGSSSDDSADWWENSQSSCGSSCCSTDSNYSFAWEEEVTLNGELFFIECDKCELTNTPIKDDYSDSQTSVNTAKGNKIFNEKKGKFSRWMRRRRSKRQRPNPSTSLPPEESRKIQSEENKISVNLDSNDTKRILVKTETLCTGENQSEKLLGLKTGFSEENQKVVVTGFITDGPLLKFRGISVGDSLLKVNGEEVLTIQSLEKILKNVVLPAEIALEFCPGSKKSTKKIQSSLVRRIIEADKTLETILENQPIGLVYINVEKQTSEKKDVIYSFPTDSVLTCSRGSFLTLFHLLSEIINSSICLSSSVYIKKHLSYVVYKAEEKSLLLITIPDSRCCLREAINIVNDLVRCIVFNHQTLYRCFTTCSTADLNHFFAIFFARVLTNGFSGITSKNIVIENIPIITTEPSLSQFEDILPYVPWIPLPKEAQIQLDDALNELEANDLDYEEDNINNQRLYNIVGSCFYHKGYLLASHLPKEDLLDLNSFCRQNCIIQLMRIESVKSLIVWKEIFPSSVNRGLPHSKSSGLSIPEGRWFLLIVGQGHDLLAVILEAGHCCVKAEGNPGPSVEYIEETEDTLRHIQKLGLSNLATQWLRDNIRCQTITPEDIFGNKLSRRRDNILSFVKTLEGTQKNQGYATPPNIGKGVSDVSTFVKSRTFASGENSEDSLSQAPSNVSEISDENAPILGRRAERVRNAVSGPTSDSENSDSDWESFKDSNRQDSSGGGSSGIMRGLCFSDITDLIPSKLTTGMENVLFHYVHLDSNEGILMCPIGTENKTLKMEEILGKFRKSALCIHTLLENNVRYKRNSQDNAKCLINKSLIAIKEHGILLQCNAPEQDMNKISCFSYWVVGRLFFTPVPREVYVCYYDGAPQNLVEIAFRLGLNTAG